MFKIVVVGEQGEIGFREESYNLGEQICKGK